MPRTPDKKINNRLLSSPLEQFKYLIRDVAIADKDDNVTTQNQLTNWISTIKLNSTLYTHTEENAAARFLPD
jgi:hypothetical protein